MTPLQKLVTDKYKDLNNPTLGIKSDWVKRQVRQKYLGQIVINEELHDVRFIDAILSKENISNLSFFKMTVGVEFQNESPLSSKYEDFSLTCKAAEGCKIQDWGMLICPFEIIIKQKNKLK